MEFKNLAEVTQLEEVPEGASVLAATAEGDVVRVPGDGLGGGGGIPTALITSNQFDAMFPMVQSGQVDNSQIPSEVTYSCKNMSFEDAFAVLDSGDMINAVVGVVGEGCVYIPAMVTYPGVMMGEPAIMIMWSVDSTAHVLAWTAAGVQVLA